MAQTPIESLLRQKILSKGAVNIAEYMSTCLYDPQNGYYMTRDPFGKKGDFITAPEISQMFGEILAVWVIDSWQKMNMPEPFNLIEAGPGRGTLMADMLRTIKKTRPTCYDSMNITLIEISPHLKNLQKQTLAKHKNITWKKTIEVIDCHHPTLLIANELFDAFPVRQFESNGNSFFERLVAIDNNDNLTFIRGSKTHHFKNMPKNKVIETCEPMEKFLKTVKRKIKRGMALFIDYGAEGTADTLQAILNHKPVPVLHEPGNVDLTAHVNFAKIKSALGTNTIGPVDMSYFLTHLGLPLRAAALLEKCQNDTDKQDILNASQKLLSPNEMGSHFKVITWHTQGLPKPAGFEDTFFQ